VFAGTLALLIAGLIVWLIRRDRLPVRHSLWWLACSVLILVFGLFPGLVDQLAALAGVSYPPSLLFVLAILALLVKLLLEDVEVSTTRRRLLRLAQKSAILEQEIRALSERLDALEDDDGR